MSVKIPCVCVVGRPNVGKSSLFNMIARKRISIVDMHAGVTRDRLSAIVRHEGRQFELVDTGGIGIVDRDELEKDIEIQIEEAMQNADLVIMVVDAHEGPLELDRTIARRLRKLDKKIMLVVNKIDGINMENATGEFYGLGFGEPLPVAARDGFNRTLLMDTLLANLPRGGTAELPDDLFKMSLIGKRNSGKSSLVNRIAGITRVIVSEIPGTTRDSIDVRVMRGGQQFVIVDTAGLRKKKSVQDSIEFYSQARTLRAIRRTDICVLLMDALEHVSQVDKWAVQAIAQESKPCILAVNKWDLASERTTIDEFRKYLDGKLPQLWYAPICFLSAKTGLNVEGLVDLAFEIYGQAATRVKTADLNKIVERAQEIKRPEPKGRRKPKIFYATQIDVMPPTIVLSVSHPDLYDDAYNRFLIGQFRQHLPMSEIPIKLIYKKRGEKTVGDMVRRKDD